VKIKNFLISKKPRELPANRRFYANARKTMLTNRYWENLGRLRWTRGGRPATTTSCPSHILLTFSSEPPLNPRPSIICV